MAHYQGDGGDLPPRVIGLFARSRSSSNFAICPCRYFAQQLMTDIANGLAKNEGKKIDP